MLKNSTQSYGILTKIFHWLMALLIIPQIVVGYVMIFVTNTNPQKWVMYGLHKSFGFMLLILIILRLVWRSFEQEPMPPLDIPRWQTSVAKWNIYLLIALMVIMPLSGILMSLLGGYDVKVFDFFTINAITKKTVMGGLSAEFHCYGGYIMSAAVTAHILAALYHHFIRKDNILKRMIVNVDA